uniref:Translocon-associated protein alpha subunit n=1 Tax=Rhizophora mucronata TaxID=61149 RepID=A0A2P2LMM6_RHIMU
MKHAGVGQLFFFSEIPGTFWVKIFHPFILLWSIEVLNLLSALILSGCRPSTMQLFRHLLWPLSHTSLLLASIYSLETLIWWAPLFMKWISIHIEVFFTMAPLKLLNLVVSSAWSQFFLLPLELPFLSSLVYGCKVKYRIFLRKQREPQRLKLELQLEMPRWMNGLRELHILSHNLPNLRRKSRWAKYVQLQHYSKVQNLVAHARCIG